MIRAAIVALVILACARIAAADPYAMPWQLRPAGAGDVVRSDTAVASYDGGTTVASTLFGSWRVRPSLAPLVRTAVVHDGSMAMSNLLLGVTWARPLAAPWKMAVLGAVTLPVGSGGGDTPDMPRLAAVKAAALARSSMDNALFAVNDAAVIAGADLAWVRAGFTVQAEVTLFELMRVRGEMAQPDSSKTNLTTGLYAGWTARPWLALGAELRYQRYLTTPAAVAADPTLRDNLSVAVGVRTKVDLGGGRVLRPGLAYARGLDDPMGGRGYDVVQLDLPLAF